MTIRTPMHPMGGGSEKKTPAGTVIFESSTSGTYSVDIPTSQNYDIVLVGGGGGSAFSRYEYIGWGIWTAGPTYGGSAGLITGTTKVTSGTYTVVVGGGGGYATCQVYYPSSIWTARGGTGGNTSFNGNIANGGGGAWTNVGAGPGSGDSGAGGTTTVVSQGLTGSNGSKGSTTSRYGSYGGGGGAYANGQSGYIKIIAR